MGVAALLQPLSWNHVTIAAAGILLLPLVSFILLSVFGQKGELITGRIASALLGLTLVLAIYTGFQAWETAEFHSRLEWFSIPHFSGVWSMTAGIFVDNLTVIMLIVVSGISFLVHIFSLAYMKGDKHFTRYYAYLGLFTFNMLALVLSDNLLILFFFWELVGFASYLLIGFWYERPLAIQASSKAFLVNRIGDVGFLLGLLILWTQFHTLDIEVLVNLVQNSDFSDGQWLNGMASTGINENWLMVAGLCLFCGVIGKSAQFPLMVWLPDAMQGPTPVSALIHAATMVAAGVYLLARVFFLLNLEVQQFISIIGALTAFMGAVAAFTRHDIKKVLAFSTISQLGYMVMGMGVGAYSASLFHLMTHAFFKACLFLSAGSVIYTMHHIQHQLKAQGNEVVFNAQDMRFMGGLGRKMPITFIAYMAATLALAGVPFFSGFLSKDAILVGAMAWAKVMASDGDVWYYGVPFLAFGTALMTAMYMGRQLFLVFFGKFRLAQLGDETKEVSKLVKEGPMAIKLPLLVLAVMSLGFFYALNPLSSQNAWFLQAIRIPEIVLPGFDSAAFYQKILIAEDEVEWAVFILTFIFAVVGFVWAYLRYRPQSAFARNYLQKGEPDNFLQRISFHNWYLDDVYNVLSRLNFSIANRLSWFDRKVIDGLVNGAGKLNLKFSDWSAKIDYRWVDGSVRRFGILNLIVAHVMSFIDRYFVDGIVNGMAYLSGKIGQITRSVQGGQVQWYFVWAIVGLLLIMVSAFI